MCVFLLIGNHRDVSYLSTGEDFPHVKAIKWTVKGKPLSIYKLVICHKYKRNIRLEIDKTLDDPKEKKGKDINALFPEKSTVANKLKQNKTENSA